MAGAEAKVRAQIAKAKARREAVFQESVQRLAEEMQTPVGQGGHMPIRTGFLRASFVAHAGTAIPAKTARPDGRQTHSYSSGPVALAIAGAGLDDTITLAWTANYARFAEHRHGFARLGVQRWKQIVAGVEAELKARAR